MKRRRHWGIGLHPRGLFPAVLVMLLLLPSGCAYVLPGVAVRVQLPAIPHPWEEAGVRMEYRVEYLGQDGRLRSRVLPAGVRSIPLVLPRRLCAPVIARPAGFLPPAGGFTAEGESGGIFCLRRKVRLSWQCGAAAGLLLELAAAGVQPDVNGPALSREMCKKGEGDPLRCDPGVLRTALGYGFFSVRHIDALPLQELLLPLPYSAGEGWVPGNPFFCGTFSPAEEGVLASGMYAGVHAFYNPQSGAAALVEVDKKGGIRVLIEPLHLLLQ